MEGRFFIRVKDVAVDELEEAFGQVQTVETDALPEEMGVMTSVITQGAYKAGAEKLGDRVISMIRVKD